MKLWIICGSWQRAVGIEGEFISRGLDATRNHTLSACFPVPMVSRNSASAIRNRAGGLGQVGARPGCLATLPYR